MVSKHLSAPAIMFVLVAATPASAIEISALVGLATDSAASLEDLAPGAQSRSGESDFLQELEFGISGMPTNELTLSYDFNAENYSDYSENSSSTHGVSGRWNRDIGDWSYGVSVDYLDMSLDGNDYLDMTMFTPSISLFSGKNFLMANALFQDKSFDQYSEFDAELAQYSFLAIRFFNGYKSNINVNFSIAEEDAKSNTYDYDEDKITFGVSHKFSIGARKYRGRFNYEIRSRDYTKVTDSAVRSKEDRDRFRLRLSTDVSENTEIEFEFDHKDREADIAASTYESQSLAMRFKYRR